MADNAPKSESIDIIASSGNVFADLGLPEPELHLAKAKLAFAITQAIHGRVLTQAQLMTIVEVDSLATSR